ncbi:class III lanthionine synthetase LanKC [Microbacterium sp. X-17]|uniref:class III lanthionine synthetase LanKC n=1 Tax=Microbacterium sp. X-17 TaxID=3144404 RepID=UPI0031F48CA4
MDAIYPRFARADAVFYEDPSRVAVPEAARFTVPADLDWAGWTSRGDGNWSAWFPPAGGLPEQGWKIHVSATLDVAGHVLEQVARYCHSEGVAFKHLPHRGALFGTNAKDADRTGSGKFVTLYPADLTALRDALDTLDARIGGMPGPYILSDLRWRRGPLSVRYGAFRHQSIAGGEGFEVLALRHPDGHLVEDVRDTAFTPPEWVELPDFLAAQREALGGQEPPPGFPRILGALHHSNAGGVYDGEDVSSGTRIVLKEGRPNAGYTPDGRDAVARLFDEETTLRRLAGLPVARVHDAFTLLGHRYLLLGRVEGESLQSSIVLRGPLIRADSAPADRAEYRRWALEVTERVEEALSLVHDAGFTHGDVHPGNAVIGADGRVTLLDLEMSQPIAAEEPVIVGAPGFRAADGRMGRGADRYGLACIKIFVFYPLTALLDLDPGKAGDLVRAAARTFALDDAWADAVHRDLALTRPAADDPATVARIDDAVARWDTHDAAAVQGLCAEIAAELAASADFTREDRAWPGDPQQFSEDGVGLAHGVAGIVHAQTIAGQAPDERALTWIESALRRPADPRRPHRPGLWDGLAGVAWLDRRLGRHDNADAALGRLRGIDVASLGSDLYGGLPGLGLLFLDECDADPTLEAEALRIAGILRTRQDARPPLAEDSSDRRVRTGSGGLLRGPTGTALFALRLFERTGDADHLQLALDALTYDLDHCLPAVDGSLQINEGWRLMPYLAAGSAGVGLVAAQAIRHLDAPERLLHPLAAIRRAARTDFAIESGLFQGRAGMIVFLAALVQLGLSSPEDEAALTHHVAELRLHALRRPHGIAFPGQALLRVSCDFATGSAGVLAALRTYAGLLEDRPAGPIHVPLLMPSAASPTAGRR